MPRRFFWPEIVKPCVITRAWAVPDPTYRQHGFNFGSHDGEDYLLGNDKRVRAPWPATVIRTGFDPNGLGYYLVLISDETFAFDDGKEARVLLMLGHNERFLVSNRAHVFPGQALAIGGSTGFSKGPHVHAGTYRVIYDEVNDTWFKTFDENDADNSFDQRPYATGTYVFDEAISGFQKALEALKVAVLSLLPQKETLQEMARRVCREEGLQDQMTRELMATIRAESRWNPEAQNRNSDATVDYGLCQMNSYWYIGEGKPIASVDEALGNPEKCVRVMAHRFVTGHADDWIAHRSGAYKQYLHLY